MNCRYEWSVRREELSVKVIRRLIDHVCEFITKVEEMTKA